MKKVAKILGLVVVGIVGLFGAFMLTIEILDRLDMDDEFKV